MQDSTPVLPQDPAVTDDQALAVLDQVISDVSQLPSTHAPVGTTPAVMNSVVSQASLGGDITGFAQAIPQTVQQVTEQAIQSAQPMSGSGTTKEAPKLTISTETPSGTGTEVEPVKELEMPSEVEAFLQKVEDNASQLPEEIVVTQDAGATATKPYPKQPVIVLPITPDVEKEGSSQPPTASVRWLVEWSKKLMKVFTGKVIYWQADDKK